MTARCRPRSFYVLTSGCACLWYGAYITKQNPAAAVNRINARFPAGMSTDPRNYLLIFVGSGTEMFALAIQTCASAS